MKSSWYFELWNSCPFTKKKAMSSTCQASVPLLTTRHMPIKSCLDLRISPGSGEVETRWHCKGPGGPEDVGLANVATAAVVGMDVNRGIAVIVGNSIVARRVGGGMGVMLGSGELVGAGATVGGTVVGTGLGGLRIGMIDWPIPMLQAPDSKRITNPSKQICRVFIVFSLPFKKC